MVELQSDRQQRAEGVVAAGPRMEGMEEELRLSGEAWRHRRMTWRRPLAGRSEQGLALLGVGSERVVCHGDAYAVGRRREIVAGVEQPIAAALASDERALDQMAFPVEVVAQHDFSFAGQ